MKRHEEVAGTPSGYMWHIRSGTPPCGDCKAAHARAVQRRKDSNNPAAATARVPLLALAALLELIPDDAQPRAAELLGDTADRARHIRPPS